MKARLWQTYTMLTDLEAVFRRLKSELGLRPVFHHKEERKAQGVNSSWTTLKGKLSVQQRVTTTFKQRDGRTLNIRKATVAEKELKEIYEKLGISATPGGIQKLTV